MLVESLMRKPEVNVSLLSADSALLSSVDLHGRD